MEKTFLLVRRTKKKFKTMLMCLNIIDSLEEGYAIVEEVLLEIHRLTVKGILPNSSAGSYRDVQVGVGNPKTGKVAYSPPVPEEVPLLTKSLLEWLNSYEVFDLMPAMQAGIAHNELARIHPSLTGTGGLQELLQPSY
jgi:Fic family protein